MDEILLTSLKNKLQCIPEFVFQASKGLFFVLIMFITVYKGMSCNQISSNYILLGTFF